MASSPGNEKSKSAKSVWRCPKLSVEGNVSELVLGGQGKLSTTTGDPGEPRKVPSTG
jgi:hypothetical protein